MSEATPKERQRNGGPGKLRGAIDGVPFTSENQPTSEQRSRAWSKKKMLKDLLGIVTNGKLGTSQTDYRKLTAEYLGIKEESVTIKMVMDFRQIEKAILKGDTSAYSAIMDRAYGRPPQQVELFGKDGEKLFPTPIFKLPDGTDVPL